MLRREVEKVVMEGYSTKQDILVSGVNIKTVNGQSLPGSGDVVVNASVQMSTVEVDLGSTPKRAGRFVITTPGLTVGRPVLVQQASGPYTGKGMRADEAEMDSITVRAKVISSTEIECFWGSNTKVWKNFKFNYLQV